MTTEVHTEPRPLLVLKKYKNRRLYDPMISDHVTDKYVRERLATHSVRIIDDQTQEDVTVQRFLQILADTARKHNVGIDVNVLENYVRNLSIP